MDWLFNPAIWLALLTLTIMELVLGIDNIVFISLLASQLPLKQRKKAILFGLILALALQILLLISISWIITLTQPLFNLADLIGLHDRYWLLRLSISPRDLFAWVFVLAGNSLLSYESLL